MVIERLGSFGGAATVFRHGALTMEASLHETDGDTVFGPNSAFTRLGLTDAVEPFQTDEFYEARGGALVSPVQIPAGLDNAQESLCRSIPEAKVAFETYFGELKRLYRTFRDLEDMRSRGLPALLGSLFSGRLFELLADARRTVAERFDNVFGENEKAKFALGAPIAYFDDDPGKLSFLLFAGIWSRYVESGSYYFKGGSQALSRALLHRVHESGGESRNNCRVVSVLLDSKGSAAGVVYIDQLGERVEALSPIIFANAAPFAVVEMLPQDKRRKFARQFSKFEPSISLFNVSLGLTRPASEFGVSAYSTFMYPDDMKR